MAFIDFFGTLVDFNYFIITVAIIVILGIVTGYSLLRGGGTPTTLTVVKEFDSSGYARVFPVKEEKDGHVKWMVGAQERDARHSHPIYPEGQNLREYWVPKDSDEALNPEQLQKDFKKTRSPSGLLQEGKHWYGELRGKLSASQALKQYWFTFLMVGGFGLVAGILLDIFFLRGVKIG